MLRTQKRQIQVYVRLDTVDTTVVAVLPELEVIRKTRRFVVFGKPEHIVLQAFQIEFLIAEALVEIHTRAVAGFFDGAAERDCVFRELDRVHAVGPGVRLNVLPVKDDRVGEGIVLDAFQHEICFVDCLFFIERLREEIDAHVKPRGKRTFDVLRKIIVRLNFAFRKAKRRILLDLSNVSLQCSFIC